LKNNQGALQILNKTINDTNEHGQSDHMINKGHNNGANKKQLPKLNVDHNDLLPKRDHRMFKWRKIVVVNIGCLNVPMQI
jgi:hypothetical protein